MSFDQLDTIKERVEYVLRNYPSSRNSDELLWWLVIKIFYKDVLEEFKKWVRKDYIPISVLNKLPKFETISRIRRKFNEQGLYLPTVPEVLEKRRKKEKVFKKYFSDQR